jgi:DNA polymerase I-like protein with 3'-5' exonuclease and polymerase domains
MEAAMNEVRRNGYVLTIEGRRQRFDMWEPKEYGVRGAPLPKDKALAAYGPDIKRAMIYAALNYKLQGSAADHFKRAMVKMLDAGIYKALGWPLALVHDEKTYSKPRTPEGNEAVKESQRILATAIEIKVPVFASSKEGPDWGSVS